jgi:hypothetical protein
VSSVTERDSPEAEADEVSDAALEREGRLENAVAQLRNALREQFGAHSHTALLGLVHRLRWHRHRELH